MVGFLFSQQGDEVAFLSFKSKKKKDDDSQSKSNVAVTVILAVVVGLVVTLSGYVGLQYLDDKQESDKNPANVAVSDADRSKALSVAELYMGKVGNFGVVSGTVDQQGDNVITVSNTVSYDSEKYPSLFVTRQMAYRNALPYVAKGSPAYFDGTVTSKWSNESDLSMLMGFEMKNLDLQADKKASYVTFDGKQVMRMKVRGKFSSHVSIRVQNGNDEKWDGTYTVQSRGFSDEPVELTMVNINNEWKVYSVDKVTKPFILANWNKPVQQGYDLKGFEVTSTIQTSRGIGSNGKPNANSSLTPEQAQALTQGQNPQPSASPAPTPTSK